MTSWKPRSTSAKRVQESSHTNARLGTFCDRVPMASVCMLKAGANKVTSEQVGGALAVLRGRRGQEDFGATQWQGRLNCQVLFFF